MFFIAMGVAVAAQSPQKPAKESKTFQRNVPLPTWAQKLSPIPPAMSKEPVVIRASETQLWLGAVPGILYSRAILVNDKNSLSAIGQFSIDYFPAYEQLQLHRLAILRNGDTIDHTKDADIKLLQRESSIEAGMMGGATDAQILLNDVRVGDTVLIVYSIHGENPVLGRKISRSFRWDENAYIESRILSITHPLSRKLYWRQVGDFNKDKIEHTIETHGDLETIRFEGKAIEAVDHEPFVPTSYLPLRTIQVSEFANWQEVAVWASGLFQKPAIQNKEVVKLAKSFSTQTTDLARASAALKWVQEQVRYFSLSIGESSHRPAKPELVISRRYGDCKDKTNLLMNLLSELGVQSTPLLLTSEAPGLPAKSLSLPTIFDHVILQVKIGENIYYVDPTASNQIAPIDQLPIPFQKASILIVDQSTQELKQIPEKLDEILKFERHEKLRVLNFAGDAEIELRQVYRGEYASVVRGAFDRLTKSELKKFSLALFEQRFSEIELVNLPKLVNGTEDETFELQASYRLKNALVKDKDKYSIEYDASEILNGLKSPEKIIRNFPYALPSGQFRGRYHFEVVFPENVREYQTSNVEKIDNPYFRITEEFSAHGNRFNVIYDFKTKASEISPKEMPAFQKQVKELHRFVQGNLNVFNSRISKLAEELFSFKNFMSLKIGSEKVALIKELNPEGIESANACNILLDIMNLTFLSDQEIERAYTEVEAQLKKRKKSEDIDIARCEARLYFNMGKNRQSIESYTRMKGKQDARDLLQMAWGLMYSNDNTQAKAYLDKLYELSKRADGVALSGQHLSQALSLFRRLGVSAPTKWQDLVKEYADTWPKPLMMFQIGQLSQDELSRQLDEFEVDTQASYRADFQFYLGQLALAQGRKEDAKLAFTWVLQNAPVFADYYAQTYMEKASLEYKSTLYFEGLYARFAGDEKVAQEKFRQLAAQGNPMGIYQLGKDFYYGTTLQGKDYKEAFRQFTLAANAGIRDAENYIGTMYDAGEGVAKDREKATQWFEKAAAKNDMHAIYNLAQRYRFGEVLQIDLTKAIEFYRRAAELGHGEAQNILARIYSQGLGTPKNLELAYKWSALAALQGNRESKLRLARLLLEGEAVERDGQRALGLLANIERKGADVWLLIGWIFEEGIDVSVDLGKAVSAYKLADSLGSVDAGAHLGLMYFEARGVEGDKSKGTEMLKRAEKQGSSFARTMLFKIQAELGDLAAQEELALAYHFGHGVPIDYSAALRWYQIAADKGSLISINNIGDLYEKGFGVERDYEKAMRHYERAAEKAYYMAFVSIGSMLQNGLGVGKNPEQAFLFYAIAEKLNPNIKARYSKRVASLLTEEKKVQLQIEADTWKIGAPMPLHNGKL